MPDRNVMGTLFADSARMLAERELQLPPQWRVTHDAWYPLETYERVAIAWLHLVGAGKPDAFKELGALTADWLIQRHPSLLELRDCRESVMRFLVMRQSFFDFAAIEVRGISDTDLQLRISHGLSQPAEAGAAYQTVGFLTRLLQHCGAAEVEHKFTSASWDSDPHTTLQMTWTPGELQ